MRYYLGVRRGCGGTLGVDKPEYRSACVYEVTVTVIPPSSDRMTLWLVRSGSLMSSF